MTLSRSQSGAARADATAGQLGELCSWPSRSVHVSETPRAGREHLGALYATINASAADDVLPQAAAAAFVQHYYTGASDARTNLNNALQQTSRRFDGASAPRILALAVVGKRVVVPDVPTPAEGRILRDGRPVPLSSHLQPDDVILIWPGESKPDDRDLLLQRGAPPKTLIDRLGRARPNTTFLALHIPGEASGMPRPLARAASLFSRRTQPAPHEAPRAGSDAPAQGEHRSRRALPWLIATGALVAATVVVIVVGALLRISEGPGTTTSPAIPDSTLTPGATDQPTTSNPSPGVGVGPTATSFPSPTSPPPPSPGLVATRRPALNDTPTPTPSDTPAPTPSDTPTPEPMATLILEPTATPAPGQRDASAPPPRDNPDPAPSDTPAPTPSDTPAPTPDKNPDPDDQSEPPGETP